MERADRDEIDAVDEALARLSAFGPEFGGGLSNHGPMVVEALTRLGRSDVIEAWVNTYTHRLEPAIAASGRGPVLGDFATVGDWERHFSTELDGAPWAVVVERWLPRLLPGMMAGATHGWLRTAHAVRSLRRAATTNRLAELGRGLAYWAARYQEVPGPDVPSGSLVPIEAAVALPDRPVPGYRLISEAIDAAIRPGDAEFAAAVDAVAPSRLTVESLLSAAAAAFRPGETDAPFAYADALTASAALSTAADLLDAGGRSLALGCAWRAVAALISTYPQQLDGTERVGGDFDTADIVDRAVASGEEHAIKVAEAAFGPAAVDDPAVRAVAAALVARLARGGR